MRTLNVDFDLPNATRALAAAKHEGNSPGFEIVRLGEIQRSARKHKNGGNEARKLLKTKDVTILDGANCACFALRFEPIWTLEAAKPAHFAQNEAKAHESKGGGRKRTSWRLDRLGICADLKM